MFFSRGFGRLSRFFILIFVILMEEECYYKLLKEIGKLCRNDKLNSITTMKNLLNLPNLREIKNLLHPLSRWLPGVANKKYYSFLINEEIALL